MTILEGSKVSADSKQSRAVCQRDMKTFRYPLGIEGRGGGEVKGKGGRVKGSRSRREAGREELRGSRGGNDLLI